MEVEQWLDTQLGRDIWNNKYRFRGESFDQWLDRVSGNDPNVKKLIIEKKFIFAGRTLTNRNTGTNGSFSNCYSHGYVPDSLSGIMDVAKNLALTYKAQGGQGLSMSKVRPKGTNIAGVYESDGIVPFINIFNTTTASISQGNARKGALMISLSALHKEIDTFIHLKANADQVTKANLSVEIDDEFMQAVEEYYKTGKVVTIHMVQTYENNTIEYDVIPIEVYKAIIQVAYDWGEPGNIFTNRFRNYNLMEYIDEYQIITGNPCGEQSLPEHGACNLASMNLSEYVTEPYTQNARFAFSDFKHDVRIGIKALDDIVDEGKDLHALEEQRIMAKNYRNIGLGIMGLGDMFFKLGIKYGSQESKTMLDHIMSDMFCEAVYASNELAADRGTFPKYSDKVFESTIIKAHFSDDEIEQLKIHGLRNCSLLSVAPTGSIGTMFDITTGIEPAFQISYNRKTESLHKDKEVVYKVFLGSAAEYTKIYHTEVLPEYFVSASDINWRDRIDIQAIAQEHVDTAISSTINLHHEITLQEIEQLYLYGWQKGLKGLTIFRDGCARLGILTNEPQKDEENRKGQKLKDILEWGTTIESSDDLIGKKRKIMSGCGSVHVQAWFDPINGKLTEVYLSKGSTGGCNSWMISNSRIMSLALRTGASFDYLIDQLKSSPACASYSVRTATKRDTSTGNCCPAAVANALVEMQKEVFDELGIEEEEANIIKKVQPVSAVKDAKKCPECGAELQFSGGCNSCHECGYSRCE